MSIERWEPFRDMVSLREAMNNLLQESFVRPGGPGHSGLGGFPLDVGETEGEYVVRASLPGIKPGDVQITVHNDMVTIRGETRAEEEKKGQTWHVRERRHGSFQRSVSLGVPIDADRSHAQFEHGVLTLTLPKSEKARPKQIKVTG
jgi:HSP20 family protein